MPRPSTKDYVIRPKSDVGGLGDMMGTMKVSHCRMIFRERCCILSQPHK